MQTESAKVHVKSNRKAESNELNKFSEIKLPDLTRSTR
jgi:hypothetical protein